MKIENTDNKDVLLCDNYFVYVRCDIVKQRLDGGGRRALNDDNTHVCVDLASKCSNVSYRLVIVLRSLDADLYTNPTPPSRFEEWHSPMKL